MRADRSQFERYRARLGDEAPKTFTQFRKLKKQGGEKWEELQTKYRNLYLKQEQNYTITEKSVTNAYSVNRKLVNSKQYHDKFEGLTSHKNANEKIYQQSKRLLEDRDGLEFERMIVLDSRTGTVITDNLESGQNKALKTGLTEEQYKKVQEHNGQFIIIHNHPNSVRPSDTDILTLWKEPKASFSIVVGHDGTIFSISEIDRSFPLDKIYEKEYNECIENGFPKTFAAKKATDKLYESGKFKLLSR